MTFPTAEQFARWEANPEPEPSDPPMQWPEPAAPNAAPSYDRTHLDTISRPAAVSPFRHWRDAHTIDGADDLDPGFGDEF